MTATSAPLTRLVLQLSSTRVDVALTPDIGIGDALRAAGIDARGAGVVVLDSTGLAHALDETVGSAVQDGGVLHVVQPAPVQRNRWGRRAGPEVLSRRPPAQVALYLIGGAAGLALAAVALVYLAAGTRLADGFAPVVAAACMAAGAIAVGFARSSSSSVRDAATASAAGLGFGAGVLVIGPDHAAAVQLAVVVGLVVATSAAAVRHVVTRSAAQGDELAGVVLVALASAAGTAASALLAGLPGSVAAALLVGVAPVLLKSLPSISITVPDEQLVDLTQVARTATSVRGPRRESIAQVSEREIMATVDLAERRKDVGTVLLSFVPPVLAPAVLLSPVAGSIPQRAQVVLLVCVVVAFALGPRVARGATARWMPRVAAGIVLLEMAVLSDAVGPIVTGGALVLALGIALVSVPLGQGWRSVGISRFADVVEGLAVVLSLPAAFVAADAIEILRRVTSG